MSLISVCGVCTHRVRKPENTFPTALISTFIFIVTILIIPAGNLHAAPIPNGPEAQTKADFDRMYLAWMKRMTVEPFLDSNPDDEAGAEFLTHICEARTGMQGAPSWEALREEGKAAIENGSDGVMVRLWYGSSLYYNRDYNEAKKVLREALAEFDDYGYPKIQKFFAFSNVAHSTRQYRRGEPYFQALQALEESLVEGEFIDDEIRIAFKLFPKNWDGLDNYPEEFCTQFEGSTKIDPWLVKTIKGYDEVKKAWEARGSGWASSVTEEGWKGFRKHLELARAALTEAWKINPRLPQAPAKMIAVAMAGHAGPHEDERLWFERAVAAQLDYRNAYYDFFWALRPSWGGSHEKMISLGEECLETQRFDTTVPYFYLYALLSVAGEKDCMNWRSVFRAPGVYDNLVKMISGYQGQPDRQDQDRILSIKILTEVYCGNYETALQLLEKADPRMKLDHGFYSKRFKWSRYTPEMIRVEARAFMGPASEIIKDADRLSIAGKVRQAIDRFKEALPLAGDDQGVKDYLLRRIGLMILEKDGEHVQITQNALHLAAKQKQPKAAAPDPDDWQPLAEPLRDNPLGLAKFLIKNGIDVNCHDYKGCTALHYAARYNHPELVALLLESGAETDSRNEKNWTPLHYALRYNAPEIAALLINRGADVNAENVLGWRPLHYACRYNYPEIAALLVQKGADVNYVKKYASAPLYYAVAYADLKIVRLLLDSGADCQVLIKDKDEQTLLHTASQHNRVAAARLLLEKGVGVNTPDKNGWTPLHCAIRYKHPKIAELLLENGAEVNARTNNGWTPILLAAHYNYPEIVKLLLAGGADPSLAMPDGRTAISIAQDKGYAKIIDILLSREETEVEEF